MNPQRTTHTIAQVHELHGITKVTGTLIPQWLVLLKSLMQVFWVPDNSGIQATIHP
jgi:hypothetical protein